MDLRGEIAGLRSVFIDTAPVIYFIEANDKFGPLAKLVVDAFYAGGGNG